MEPTTTAVVPYVPNFDDDTISDMDLLSALCGMEENNKVQQTTVTTKSNTLNNLLSAMFSNCGNVTIGTINFNITK